MKLIPHSLTAGLWSNGIRSLAGFGKLVGPLAHPVLYLHCCAIPHRLPLSLELGALVGGLGCFPFDYEAHPP